MKATEVENGIFKIGQDLFLLIGIHGNFLLGKNDSLEKEKIQFFASQGGIMKVLNLFNQKGSASNEVFSTFGATEVLFNPLESFEHPYEQWGVSFYSHHFEVIQGPDFTHLVFHRKGKSFLFLDPKITIFNNAWVFSGDAEQLYFSLEKKIANFELIFSFGESGLISKNLLTPHLFYQKLNF